MKKIYFLSLCLLLVSSCGVKERSATPVPEPLLEGQKSQLPENVSWTSSKKFLLFGEGDHKTFTVGKMSAVYRIVTPTLAPVSDLAFSVFYNMPEMPDMPVDPVVVEKLSATDFRVTYDISMGGLWYIKLTLGSDAQGVDEIAFPEFTVPE